MTTGEVEPARVEEIFLLCTAPPEQVAYDGWLVRTARDDVKRARSVNAFSASTKGLSLDAKIEHCERTYAQAGLPPLFRLTPFSRPATLDDALALRGYEVLEPSFVQVSRLSRPLPPAPDGVRFESMLLEDWLEQTADLRGRTQAQLDAEFRRMHHGDVPGYCSIARVGDEAVACGIVMQEQEFAGLFDVFVAEAQRGRGLGTAISTQLLATARRMSAEIGWLSVLQANAPALAVYAKLGFETLYEYWYRARLSV